MAKSVHPLSTIPLALVPSFNGQPISTASGFVIRKNDDSYLITNWHVVSGRHPETNKLLSDTGAVPNELLIWHHIGKKNHALGKWASRQEPLVDSESGRPLWIEHSSGKVVDVVALKLTQLEDVRINILQFPNVIPGVASDILLHPSEPVSIIGYPKGNVSSGLFPIWKTGHIASDIDMGRDGRPVFLIDATTQRGMSGSPVIALRTGYYMSSSGSLVAGKTAVRFLGIYSNRLGGDRRSVGLVWKPEVINEILKNV